MLCYFMCDYLKTAETWAVPLIYCCHSYYHYWWGWGIVYLLADMPHCTRLPVPDSLIRLDRLHPVTALTIWACPQGHIPDSVCEPEPHSSVMFTLLYAHWIKIPVTPFDDLSPVAPLTSRRKALDTSHCFTDGKHPWIFRVWWWAQR